VIPEYDPFNREDDGPIRLGLEGRMIERDGKFFLEIYEADSNERLLFETEICIVVAKAIYRRSSCFYCAADGHLLPEALFSLEEATEICKRFDAR
jgi:hypothetical protein